MGKVKKTWQGRDLVRSAHRAAGEGNTESAEYLLEVALGRVPRESNDLAATGTVTTDGDGRAAAVSFSGDYAAVQHEDLTFEHPSGGEAKFLERPARTEHSAMLKAAAGPLQRLFRQ